MSTGYDPQYAKYRENVRFAGFILDKVRKDPRYIVIAKRVDSYPVSECPKPLMERHEKCKEGLIKIYSNDPKIKKEWKLKLAIEKLLAANDMPSGGSHYGA